MKRDDSPIGTEEEYQVSVSPGAIEKLCKEVDLLQLIQRPREYLATFLKMQFLPDWAIAGLNCKKDEDIVPIVIYSQLMNEAPK